MHSFTRLFVGALVATVATVATTRPLAAQTAAADSTASLTGRVLDQTVGFALPNAEIQLVSTATLNVVRRMAADAQGRFTMLNLPAGSYLLGFQHPRLDSLLLDPLVTRVDLIAGERTAVALAIPAVDVLYDAWCTGGGNPAVRSSSIETTGVFLGHVRSADGGTLPEATRVEVNWMDVLIDRRGAGSERQTRVLPVRADGSFAVCGLPPEGILTVRAFADAAASGLVDVEVPSSRLLVRDLFMARDSASTGRLRGVIASADNAPIAGARVRVAGDTTIVLTDVGGRFAIADAPVGTQTLEVVALGHVPRRLALDIPAGGSDTMRVVMQSTRNQLEQVTVTANSWRAGFEDRRTRRYGQFLDEDAIRRKQPTNIADVFRAVPTVVTKPTGSFGSVITVRGCDPTVFLDGKRVLQQTYDLDAVLAVDNLVAVEVYDLPEMVPLEFHSQAFCGAILLWTRTGRP